MPSWTYCPECRYLIVDLSAPCPSCGAAIPAAAASVAAPRASREGGERKKFSKRTIAVILFAVIVVLAAGGGFYYFQSLQRERAELEAIRIEQERIARLALERAEQERIARLEQERIEQERQERITVERAENNGPANVLQVSAGAANINLPIPEGFADTDHTMPDLASSMKEFAPVLGSGSELLAVMMYAEDLHDFQNPSFESFAFPRSRTFTAFATPENEWRASQSAWSMLQGFPQMGGGSDINEIEIFRDYQGDIGLRISELIASGDMPSGFGTAFFNLESEYESSLTWFMYMYFELFDERMETSLTQSAVSVLINGHVISAMIMSYSIHDLNWTQDVLRNWAEAILRAN